MLLRSLVYQHLVTCKARIVVYMMSKRLDIIIIIIMMYIAFEILACFF